MSKTCVYCNQPAELDAEGYCARKWCQKRASHLRACIRERARLRGGWEPEGETPEREAFVTVLRRSGVDVIEDERLT